MINNAHQNRRLPYNIIITYIIYPSLLNIFYAHFTKLSNIYMYICAVKHKEEPKRTTQ